MKIHAVVNRKAEAAQIFVSDHHAPAALRLPIDVHVLIHDGVELPLEQHFGVEFQRTGTARDIEARKDGVAAAQQILPQRVQRIRGSRPAVQANRSVPHQIVERRPGDVAACYADPSLALRELGWSATRDLPEMCADAWRWQSQNPQGFA